MQPAFSLWHMDTCLSNTMREDQEVIVKVIKIFAAKRTPTSTGPWLPHLRHIHMVWSYLPVFPVSNLPPPFMPLGSSGLPSFFLAIWVFALLHQQAPHLHYLNQSQNCGRGGRVRLSLLAWETSWHEDYLRLLRNFSSTLFICNWHSLSTDFGVE